MKPLIKRKCICINCEIVFNPEERKGIGFFDWARFVPKAILHLFFPSIVCVRPNKKDEDWANEIIKRKWGESSDKFSWRGSAIL